MATWGQDPDGSSEISHAFQDSAAEYSPLRRAQRLSQLRCIGLAPAGNSVVDGFGAGAQPFERSMVRKTLPIRQARPKRRSLPIETWEAR